MSIENVETLIIGGGQAGLAMSHMLKQRGRPHLILERYRIAERWRTERWDGLRFQFPNWSVGLPDFPFPHTDADGFATTSDILDYIAAYAAFVAPPIRCGVSVTALRHRDGASDFVVETCEGPIEAANVVVATGPYQRAVVPALFREDVSGFQMHASRYTNPDQLPAGTVLVIGSGASGAQITEELFRSGRLVYLSVGQHSRLPRRYRGRDLMWWFGALGLLQMPAQKRGPIRKHPAITGAYGGHTIDFRRFAADGVTLLGRAEAMHDGVMRFAPDVADSLANGDAIYATFLDMADDHVKRHSLEMPDDPAARETLPDPPCLVEPLRRLDFRDAGIGAVIWATGYSFDFSWIDLPVLNARGEAVHRRGVTDVAGLYFLGLPWLSNMNSSFLSGVGDDAARVADHIVKRVVPAAASLTAKSSP
ncbi:MAG: NAD(P)-binding domain-containing protein [Bradyrhizobium sp.]